MTRPLILVAASGLAREAAVAATDTGEFDVIGYADDDAAQWGQRLDGVPVLGGLDVVFDRPEACVVLCAGRGATRAAIAQRLAAGGFPTARYATVIHPSVQRSGSSSVGAGSIVLAGTVLTTSVTVGAHVVVMPNVTLTHDNVLADYATVTAGVSLGGWVRVGDRAYLGMNCCVRERVRVGADAVVGMGAVVLRDVRPGVTVVGNPAHEIFVPTMSA